MSDANHLAASPLPRFFAVDEPGLHGVAARPADRETVRLTVRSLSVMQKEAVVVSGGDGRAWRLTTWAAMRGVTCAVW